MRTEIERIGKKTDVHSVACTSSIIWDESLHHSVPFFILSS